MRAIGRTAMEKMQLVRHSFRGSRWQWLQAAGMGLLFALLLGRPAQGQQISVTGTVTNAAGTPLRGVAVHVQGTTTRVTTDASGKYSIGSAPANGILSFTMLGQRGVQQTIAGRSTIDVTMAPIAFLEEMVVTAYGEQRRADITGAVASAKVETVERQTGASVLQRLDVSVPGVTVDASGSPGSRSTVRVRGISSFQNNDPLYIVDGVPVQDSYINWLNPDDITSVQVLKDASAASIYGSRASNGVIIIETTKKGVSGPPRATLRVRTGVATPTRGYDDILLTDPLAYFQVVKASYANAGQALPDFWKALFGDPNNPTLPKYIFADPTTNPTKNTFGQVTGADLSKYSYPNNLIMQASAGTNWWKQVFGSAPVGDYNLDVSGGGEDNAYSVSMNYFTQDGTAIYNTFRRGGVRANTSFNRGRLNFGENAALSLESHTGGIPDDAIGEDGIVGKNILMQPIIPVRDVNGNFAGGKATGLGNQSNPVKYAYSYKDNTNRNDRIFGNVFGGFAFTPAVNLRSSLGFNVGQSSFNGFFPAYPENAEATFTNSIDENTNQFLDWTWSNTLKLDKKLDRHGFSVLVGQEAIGSQSRYIDGTMAGLLNTDVGSRYIQDALGDASTKNVSSTGSRSALLSIFGKADYNFADKYVASFTVRRDGSSRLSPGHQWGTFPAFGVGWRVSKEPFLAGNHMLSDLMLRFGWGVTGNQLIPSGRIVAQYGGSRGDTYYDVGGGGSSVAAGFRQTSLGNADLRWEEQRSTNIGADAQLFDGFLQAVLDVYTRNTNNLLFDPALPSTAGVADPPIVNVGKMRNTGFDLSLSHQSATWSLAFNGSHYNNKIVAITNDQTFFYGPITTRYGNQVINQVGQPIGAFYGYLTDGYFQTAADVAAHTPNAGGTCSSYCQPGAALGRLKFKDVNGDGQLTLSDRTIIGSPHPKFTGGIDATYRRGNFDVSATVFGSYGNKIFENQMEFYVFREFNTNVRKDLLANSWTPQNPNAKYPILDVNDAYSHALSDFYVKDGSYTRLRALQIGYNVPSKYSRFLAATRVYVQGENLFTITGYEGLDPSLPAQNVTGPAGDIRDQYRGVDRGTYPSNRTFSVGIVTSF